MPNFAPPFFGRIAIAAGAIAVSIYSKIIAVSVKPFLGSDRGAALWFQSDTDVWVGNNSSLTDSSGDGFLLLAGTPFPDSATAFQGNNVPCNTFFLYRVGTTAAITAATNANPVVLTSASHGLATGQSVMISGGTGNWTAINGTFTVTVIDADTFSIPANSTALGALAGSPVFAINATVSVYFRSVD